VKKPGGLSEMAGRTTWPARVPLDRLPANETGFIHAAQADGGAG
jgi:hypothetical protein